MHRSISLLLTAAISGAALAQSNERGANYDGALTDVGATTASGGFVFNGRTGVFPNGEMALSFRNQLCNPGLVPVEWQSAGTSTVNQMKTDHPKFSFLVCREVNGRFQQISDWSFCKHAFTSTNSSSTCGGSCTQPPNGGQQCGVKCSDVYGASTNASQTWLSAPGEINPWLGTWAHVGSFFDIGHPGQAGYPLPADGVRSLSISGLSALDSRVRIMENQLQGTLTGSLYFQIQVIHEGERVENRGNNMMSRPFGLTWTGSTWSIVAPTSVATYGSILTRWAGSTMTIGQNGDGTFAGTSDGRFAVAVKVAGPTNGLWHYEYAVHNIDNNRGGASFRLPVCSSARVLNIGSRDIDQNPLNDWTSSVVGGEIVFQAPAGNAHRWNQVRNFWFDSDAAPVAGNASIDEADPGPGALTVTVATSVPAYVPIVHLGNGCGTPAATLTGNGGLPTAGNAAFGIMVTSAPAVPYVLLFSGPIAGAPIVPGCDFFIDANAFGNLGGFVTDAAGTGLHTTGVDALWGDVHLQAATLIPSPPILGILGLSSAIRVRYNGAGCP
ncbi:MAG: hypothetical protein JNK78_13640 [Planctomycetes bacterium]|nr:hypothetical protein [Planctomycetota bacterium]